LCQQQVCVHTCICRLLSPINRSDYVYAACKKCGVACAARPTKGSKNTWRVTKMDSNVAHPCSTSVPQPPQTKLDAEEPEEQGPEEQCDLCKDGTRRFVTCDSGHVFCTDCIEASIDSQCMHVSEFVLNRGIICCLDPPSSSFRFSLDKIKQK